MTKRQLCPSVLIVAVVTLFLVATAAPAAENGYEVSLAVNQMTGQVGQDQEIEIEIADWDLPSGVFYTVSVDAANYPGPEGPHIVSGLPLTKVTCNYVGQYLIKVRVNLVKKTSCGGASFVTLLEDQVELVIAE